MSTKKAIIVPDIKLGIEGVDFFLTILFKKHAGKTIYKVEYELNDDKKCINYVDNENKHVLFKNRDNIFILFHLENKPITESLIESIKIKLMKKRNSNRNEDLIRDVILLQSCLPDIDLLSAQQELIRLNEILQKKCPNLFLKLDHFFDFQEPMVRYNETGHICVGCKYYDTLILALCKEKNCIATIEIIIRPEGEVLINSKTDTLEEGKKYNKLLRAVLFIIGNKIPDASYIKSTALNPISAWLLIKYSKAFIETGNPFIGFLKEKNIDLKSVSQELIKEYYKVISKPIVLIANLDKEAVINSNSEFQKLLIGNSPSDEIKCT